MTDTATREDLAPGTELRAGDGTVIAQGPTDAPIYRILPKLIGEMPVIGKEGKAPENMGGYAFRKVEDVLDELKPLLAKHGVFYVPTTLERLAETRTTRNGAALYVVHLHVRFRFYGPRGDYVDADVWGEGMDNFDKSTNKAHTTALKNALIEVLSLASGEPDSEAGSHDETVPSGQNQRSGRGSRGGKKKPPNRASPQAATQLQALGWRDPDEGVRLHDAVAERIRVLPDDDRNLVKDFRSEASIEWPMGPDDWNRLDDFVRELEAPPEGPDESKDEGAEVPGGEPFSE